MLGIFVGTAALIIILSVFNGFESLVKTLYNKFDPAVKVMPISGKTFKDDTVMYRRLTQIKGVHAVSAVLEENALLRNGDYQCIATLKGVEDNYDEIAHISTAMHNGRFELRNEMMDFIILGEGVAQILAMQPDNPAAVVNIYIPKKNGTSAINPEDAFKQQFARPLGFFAIQQEFDAQYAFVPISMMHTLLENDSAVSCYEIGIDPGANLDQIKAQVSQIAGAHYLIKDRYEQNETLYKTMRSEKWAVYAILLLVIIIASFNMTGSLSMLVMEKTRDIQVLQTMGAHAVFIRRIFLYEGLLMCTLAACGGLLLGYLICLAQQVFGIVKLGGSTFVIDAYPVHMQLMDFIMVWTAVMLIGFTASFVPARKAAQLRPFKL